MESSPTIRDGEEAALWGRVYGDAVAGILAAPNIPECEPLDLNKPAHIASVQKTFVLLADAAVAEFRKRRDAYWAWQREQCAMAHANAVPPQEQKGAPDAANEG